MGNTELIKELKENFLLLQRGAISQLIGETIRSSVRLIQRLKTEDRQLDLVLKKIAADIMSVYTNQVNYSEMRNKSENPGLNVRPEFDDSFFESLLILKKELFDVLKKI